jgi:hypothetical protein
MKKYIYGLLILVIGLALGYQAREYSSFRLFHTGHVHLKAERPRTQAPGNTKQNISTSTDGMNRKLILAREMLKSKFGTATPFQDRSAMEIGKILNHIVFNHCSNTQPHTGQKNKNELFEVCRTSCAGYAYVLRGLFAVYGIKTRYANLYNLPGQGNHTMVEAEIHPGKWALFDPTFGAFFSSNGRVNGTPLSLEEIRFNLTPESLSKHIFTAKKNNSATGNIKNLYEKSVFDYPYMKIQSYLSAEIAAPAGLNLTVPLTLPLNVVKGRATAGVLNAKTIQEGEAGFLAWTNSALSNNDPSDDTSYLFHILGDYSSYFRSMNVISLTGLRIGTVYDLNISGFSNGDIEIQVVDIGRNLVLNSILPEKLTAGREYLLHRKFRAHSESAQLVVILNGPQRSLAYIFGVSVGEEKRH